METKNITWYNHLWHVWTQWLEDLTNRDVNYLIQTRCCIKCGVTEVKRDFK